MGIDYSFKEKPVIEAHGYNAVMGENDFSSKSDLKNAIKSLFNNFKCPSCGGHRIEGDKINVEIGKVKFFQEEKRKRLFGLLGETHVEKHEKDIWRLYGVFFESSGFLSSAGYIKCKSCKWEEKGNKGSSIQWYSINDILNGKL